MRSLPVLLLCLCIGFSIHAQTNDDLLFIRHSVGRLWLEDSLEDALLAKDYLEEVNSLSYSMDVSADSGRPESLPDPAGDYTDMNYWLLWFNDYFGSIDTYDCASGVNRIIMFKSCYPNSGVTADGTLPGDPFSTTRTVTNYQAIYRHADGSGNTYTYSSATYKPLEDIFAEHPDILFIPVTSPPLHYAPTDATNDDEGHRVRTFNNWLKNEWLPSYRSATGLNNVAVFDLFDVVAYPDDDPSHPNRLRAEYGGESGDSHPTSPGYQALTALFATDVGNFIDTAWAAFNGGESEGEAHIVGGGWLEVGDPLSLEVVVSGAVGEATYQWLKDGSPLAGETHETYEVAAVTVSDEGSYVCRITDDSKGQFESAPAWVTVVAEGELPVADLGALCLSALASAAAGALALRRKAS